MARLQKCGGVHRKSTTASTSGTAGGTPGAIAAAPARTAKLPASPPTTMFHHVRRLSQTV